MHDPEFLTRDRFAENLNTNFDVLCSDGQTFTLKLAEVSKLKLSNRTECFSLLFESPLDWFLLQGMHTLKHERMGTFELFLVPVFKEETCFVYEALFNRLVKQQ